MKIKTVLAVVVIALTLPLSKVTLASEPTVIDVGSEYEDRVMNEYNRLEESGLSVVSPEKKIGNEALQYRLVNYKDREYDVVFEIFGYFCKNENLYHRYLRSIRSVFNKSPKKYMDVVQLEADSRRASLVYRITMSYSQCEGSKTFERIKNR